MYSAWPDKVVNVTKLRETFFPPQKEIRDEDVKLFRRAVESWLETLSREGPDLLHWGTAVVEDADIFNALLELVYWYKPSAEDLLSFLMEQRLGHVPARELRARLRGLGKKWKEVERLALKALKESEPYLGERRDLAVETVKNAWLLCTRFIEAAPKRPLETEIAECKKAIELFLRRRGVRKVNEYGWVLLRAVFGRAWKAGDGENQIEAYRAIPAPFTGRLIGNPKELEKAIEQAKLDFFLMKKEANR